MLKRLNSLWVGDRLGYIERLSLVSAAAAGHPVTLYSFTPDTLRGVPPGIELRNAREVMPEEKFASHSGFSWFSLAADFFRYELLFKNLGYWIDADIYVIKPLSFEQDYIFGLEHEHTINGAVLYIPSDSEMLNDLRTLPLSNRCPPWYGPKRKIAYYWKRLRQGSLNVEDLPWGTFGPLMLTYLAKKHNLYHLAQKPSVFYPVSWKSAQSFYEPFEVANSSLRPDTHAVHLYNSRLVGLNSRPPPVGSYLDIVCRRHGIDTTFES